MTLEDRIGYWRGRARLAQRFGLRPEAEASTRIAATLTEARKTLLRADKVVEGIDVPEELANLEAKS